VVEFASVDDLERIVALMSPDDEGLRAAASRTAAETEGPAA
jgi:predicted nucleotide-binding protein